MRVIILICWVSFTDLQTGYSLKAISKIDFQDPITEIKKANEDLVETFEIDDYDTKSELKDNTKSEISCNNKKCVFSYDDGQKSGQKISTNVHVRISTDVQDSSKEEDEEDVPIFVGYTGVNPKDVNTENLKLNTIKVPVLTLEPPILEPKNWYDYLGQKDKPSSSTTTKKPYFFYPYEIGHENHENVIPPGWSSGWKPMDRFPSDHYHYNINRKEGDFITNCACNRIPIHRVPKPIYHVYPRSWIVPETTTKIPLDGKLLPKFNSENKQ